MSTDLEVTDRREAVMSTAIQLRTVQLRMQMVLAVMANVLEEGKDYGRIPGTDKPTLYKPGAEKLMLTFRLAAGTPTIEDLSTDDAVRYRLGVPIVDDADHVLAVGVGEASTDEEKYRWRRPVCDDEFESTPVLQRRLKWFRGSAGKPAYQGQQIKTSPADLANTVLKMAHKRAFVHATLLATGASSVFNQDLEDFENELRDAVVEADPVATVQRASATGAAPARASAPATGPVTAARKVRDVKPAGKDKHKPTFWVLLLVDDATEYTTKDERQATELLKFKGTDHAIRVAFEVNEWNGKTYHNIKSFAIADADPPVAPAAAPAVATGDISSGDIPF